MTRVNYVVTDDFKARQIYEKAISYSRARYTDAKVTGFSADNINHRWREDVIEFNGLKTEVRLRLYNYPEILNKRSLPEHSLLINFFGKEIESAKRRLEGLTGIRLE